MEADVLFAGCKGSSFEDSALKLRERKPEKKRRKGERERMRGWQASVTDCLVHVTNSKEVAGTAMTRREAATRYHTGTGASVCCRYIRMSSTLAFSLSPILPFFSSHLVS